MLLLLLFLFKNCFVTILANAYDYEDYAEPEEERKSTGLF
jgi:hypothetical protein